ncbi:helix-turn-helix domain-containing protein [Rugosimonospora acidiphila]|uniref:helix-turn-helix domain-containing protein n=1 Tax=Rugosimonospora acidiphila TaxID=556531 RepID=UPI003CD05D0E
MGRYTAFRFTVDASPRQAVMLARHAGAARFAYNQCLRLRTRLGAITAPLRVA